MEDIYSKIRSPKHSTHIFSSANGSNRATVAIESIFDKVSIGQHNISYTKNVLLQIASGNEEITIDEIGLINDFIQNKLSYDANVIMNVVEKDIADNIEVEVIFTDINLPSDIDTSLLFNNYSIAQDSISIYISDIEYSSEEIAEVISFLSDLYHDIGGDRLKIKGFQAIEVESLVEPLDW